MDTPTYAKLEQRLGEASKRSVKAIKAYDVLKSELKFRKASAKEAEEGARKLRKLELAMHEAQFLRNQATDRCKDAHVLVKCAEDEARTSANGQNSSFYKAQQRTKLKSEEYEAAEEKREKQRKGWYRRQRNEEEKVDQAEDQQKRQERGETSQREHDRASAHQKRRERQERQEQAKKEREERPQAEREYVPPRMFPPGEKKARPKPRRQVNAVVEAIAQWREDTEAFFNTPDQPFPDPPSFKCERVSCVAQAKSRSLKVCGHSIRMAFQNVYPKIDVKKERLRWHPDKVPDHQGKAREVFCVLQELYENDRKKAEKKAAF
jgi:hypothetical protein